MSAQGKLFRAHAHIRPRRANFFAHEAQQHSDVETNNTTAHPQQGSLETGITSAPEKCTKNAHFTPAKAMAVSVKARPAPAKAMAVSDNRPSWPTGSGCGTHGRRQGLAGSRDNAPSQTSAHQAPRVWRAPEGPEGTGGTTSNTINEARRRTTPRYTRRRGCGGRRRDLPRCRWAVAGPGRASRRRAEPKARGADGSRAGRRPPAHTAAGPSGARNTRGATSNTTQQPDSPTHRVGITKPPGPTGAGRFSQFRKLSAESRQCRGLRGRSPGGRWKYRAWKQRPSRFPPCGGPRRRRWRSAWPSRRRSRRRCLRSRPG